MICEEKLKRIGLLIKELWFITKDIKHVKAKEISEFCEVLLMNTKMLQDAEVRCEFILDILCISNQNIKLLIFEWDSDGNVPEEVIDKCSKIAFYCTAPILDKLDED